MKDLIDSLEDSTDLFGDVLNAETFPNYAVLIFVVVAFILGGGVAHTSTLGWVAEHVIECPDIEEHIW